MSTPSADDGPDSVLTKPILTLSAAARVGATQGETGATIMRGNGPVRNRRMVMTRTFRSGRRGRAAGGEGL